MMLGTLVVAACLLLLGFTREFVDIALGTSGDDERAKAPTIILAVLAIYGVDFAINVGMFATSDTTHSRVIEEKLADGVLYTVMSCSRSLLVDTLPTEKQQLGAAWCKLSHLSRSCLVSSS